MSSRTIVSIIAAGLLCGAFISTEADARGGARGGGMHAGGARAGGVARAGGAYRGAAVRGGAYRGAAVRGGVTRNVAYRGGTYYGGYRPGWGVGAAAVGAAAAGAAAAPYYYNNYNRQCGYYPYPPCY